MGRANRDGEGGADERGGSSPSASEIFTCGARGSGSEAFAANSAAARLEISNTVNDRAMRIAPTSRRVIAPRLQSSGKIQFVCALSLAPRFTWKSTISPAPSSSGGGPPAMKGRGPPAAGTVRETDVLRGAAIATGDSATPLGR